MSVLFSVAITLETKFLIGISPPCGVLPNLNEVPIPGLPFEINVSA